MSEPVADTVKEEPMADAEPASVAAPSESSAVAVETKVEPKAEEEKAPQAEVTPVSIPSNAEIEAKLNVILLGADLDSLTSRKARKELETVFGCDLTEKKAFIDEKLLAFVEQRQVAAETAAAAAAAGFDVEETDVRRNRSRAAAPKPKTVAAKRKAAPTPERKKAKAAAAAPAGSDDEADDRDDADASDVQREKVAVKAKKPTKKKTVYLRPALSEFFDGQEEMGRGDIVRGIHDYAKAHNLKDPSNGQFILCDEKLQKAFKKKRLHMFRMAKDIEKMIIDSRFL
jgi:upstream activation factor subunit UAF30